MIIQGNGIDGVTLWLYMLVLGAIAARVLYRFFTSATRKSSRKNHTADSNGSSGAMVDNDRGCGGGVDGHCTGDGGDGGGGGGD
ncbi:hypothetical protein F7R01_02425 [Pseudomonas argentinensis]|uniref:Uncharacterized protein n=1 Tax=Phytopseudomonas argentinensis TaxID=289370 RepID=A0A1I3N9S1_9GAMM|nr:hypothetical protein [Pseudomonas argentinensis]KAB0550090.1 hypothetical protein F7R01_02425 [Pseudomonas argentinensis]SFJ05947.1 hypothetical protein SAMN05216602_3691 [Pseudomonas argentinensis]